MRRVAPLILSLACSAVAAGAPLEGSFTIVGYNDMREMLEPVVARFEKTHPGVHIDLRLPGTRFAPAALARGESALAPMGAEFTPPQLAEYLALRKDDPIAFRVAHASLDPRALSGPLALFVHRDNPIAALTLVQAARIFSGEARTWGALGLEGDWKARPIHAYGMAQGTALSYAFHDAAMGGREYDAGMTGLPQSAEVVRRVSEDPLGTGFAAAMRAIDGTRVVPIAAHAGGEPILPSEESLRAGRYPLDRFLLIYAPRPLTPFAREFVRTVLSREGQEAVAATPQKYLPLSERELEAELEKLGR